MPELRAAAVAFALTNFEIGGAAQSIRQLVENLAGFSDALLRQHGVGILFWMHRSTGGIAGDVRGAR
jgi:hypothetical protein